MNRTYPTHSKKKYTNAGRWLALAMCIVLMCSAFGGAMRSRASSPINLADVNSHAEMSPADIYEANVNSTVGITTSITINQWGYQTTSAASGSGFIISDDGYILTNYHVVEDSETITVTLYDDTAYEAELVGFDESNDVAILKVEAENLVPVTVGDSNALRVGDPVYAIGNPLGELTFSLTGGMVSALNREITISSGVTMDLIQTDCAINSGNSGGALFNEYGEVIGITNAKYSSSGSSASIDNIGFAIPISRVITIVQSIIENGYIAKPFIGVTVSDVSDEVLAYGLPKGASVHSVTEDTPAEKAGLQVNDIIVALDGEPITGRRDLVARVGVLEVGSTHTITVYRQGETIELTIEIGEQVQSALPEEEEEEKEETPAAPWGQMDQFPFDSFEDFIQGFGGGHMS